MFSVLHWVHTLCPTWTDVLKPLRRIYLFHLKNKQLHGLYPVSLFSWIRSCRAGLGDLCLIEIRVSLELPGYTQMSMSNNKLPPVSSPHTYAHSLKAQNQCEKVHFGSSSHQWDWIIKISAKLLKDLGIYGLKITGLELQAFTSPESKHSACKVCMLFYFCPASLGWRLKLISSWIQLHSHKKVSVYRIPLIWSISQKS